MDRAEAFLSNILKSLNDAMPKRPVRYKELVRTGMYVVETVGGGIHRFDPEEVAALGRKLPEHVLENLHLPFVFVKSFEAEESIYYLRVYGSEEEAFQSLMSVRTMPRTDRGPYTYKPFVAEFINRFPTLAVMGYL
ncbi:MAG: DUF61 family protein [Candidatus Caldarchaeum sp.]